MAPPRTTMNSKWVRCQDGTLLNLDNVSVIKCDGVHVNDSFVVFAASGDANEDARITTIAEFEYNGALDDAGYREAKKNAEELMSALSRVVNAYEGRKRS